MAIEDRIRPSVDAALSELNARIGQDLRRIIEDVVRASNDEQADVRRELEAEADRRLHEARVREREAEMAGVTRLVESIRALDNASSLGEVLDALGQAAARETSRAGVFVLRGDRLVGWRLTGFGTRDTQPKSIDFGLSESGVIGLAVGAARSVTTRDGEAARAPHFADLPADRLGFAVPVVVGGRAVAVVYADTATEGHDQSVPSAWPETIEVLTRHAARCLEALTVQKVVNVASPRFWVPTTSRTTATQQSQTASASTAKPVESDAPPGVSA